MECEAFLADSVVAAEGKLYVQGGGWNQVNAPALPFRMPRCGIAMLVHVPYTGTNQPHKFDIRLKDADGEDVPLGDAPPGVTADGKIRRVSGEFNMGRPPTVQPGDEQLAVFAINFDGLVFEQPNRYEFVIELDGTPVKNLGFRVLQIPQMAAVVQ